MNKAYRDLVLGRVANAVTNARALAPVPHAGLKGQLREAVVRDLVRPLLPPTVGIGQGQIVAHDGQISSQTDVILYDRRILPPVLFEDLNGVFPIEAVLATLEVKSVLNASELRRADEAARKLARFPYLPGIRDVHTGLNLHHSIERLVPTLFALSTDLKATRRNDLERMRDLKLLSEDGLRAICVVGRGSWLAIGKGWYQAPMGSQYAEVMGFMSAITSSLIRIAATRYAPDVNQYLFEPEEMPVPGRDGLPGFTS